MTLFKIGLLLLTGIIFSLFTGKSVVLGKTPLIKQKAANGFVQSIQISQIDKDDDEEALPQDDEDSENQKDSNDENTEDNSTDEYNYGDDD